MAKTSSTGKTSKKAAAKPVKKAPALKKSAVKKPAAKKTTAKATALVTGAAGFVGSHVVEELVSAGFNVVATDSPGANLAAARAAGAETVEADITSAESAAALFKGRKIDFVAHLAALYDLGAPRARLMDVNRDGAANMFRAANAAKVKHFVFFSTGDVYGQPDEMPVTEECEPSPLNPYAESKLAAERIALEMHAREGFPVTIIRPTVVYGPRSKYVLSVFFSIPGIVNSIGDRINLHLPQLRVFRGGALVSWVHARDLARAVRFLFGKKEALGQIYNVADDSPVSLEELFKTIFAVFGYEWIGAFPYPKQLVTAFARAAMRLPDSFTEWITKFMQTEWARTREKYSLGEELIPRFDSGFLSFMLGDRVYDNSKIKSLGFEFKYPDAAEGLHETVQWYQDNNWLPKVED